MVTAIVTVFLIASTVTAMATASATARTAARTTHAVTDSDSRNFARQDEPNVNGLGRGKLFQTLSEAQGESSWSHRNRSIRLANSRRKTGCAFRTKAMIIDAREMRCLPRKSSSDAISSG